MVSFRSFFLRKQTCNFTDSTETSVSKSSSRSHAQRGNEKINTGLYTHIINQIPDNKFYHITDLIEEINKKGKVGGFPIPERSWHNIGQWKEYTDTLAKYSNTSFSL